MNKNMFQQGLACAMICMSATAFSKGTGLAYVTSEKDDTLTMVDIKTLEVKGTIKTCKRPRHIQFVNGDMQVLVACAQSNAADLIDLASKSSVKRIPLGEDPEAFDVSPDGKTIYVSNEDDALVSFIDIATGKATKTVKVGKEPEGVLAHPNGKLVFVTSEVANMVHVIDVAQGKVVKSIPVGKRPRRFALTPDGNELWVSNELSASVSVIRLSDLSVSDTVKLELKGAREDDITPVGLQFTKDGKTAYVTMGRANHVAFVDVASRKVAKTVLVGKRAWGLALSKDGSRLFVANGLSDDMTVIDVAAAKAIKSVPVGRVPYGIVLDE